MKTQMQWRYDPHCLVRWNSQFHGILPDAANHSTGLQITRSGEFAIGGVSSFTGIPMSEFV